MKPSPLKAVGRRLGPIALAAVASLAGCVGGQPFDYTPVDEIPPGPGLFSGADGAFTIGFGGKAEPDDAPDNGAD